MGKVYLVGAGPGDAGLLTIKGMGRLRECDAVIYDRLASEELLEYTGGDCEKIYVGKQAGKHSKRQDEINRILVECAKRHQCVVRLKGGDSFVFGRGGEEIEALEEAGIPYELVPGVTSAVAVPECAGIPVTHRGVSRSFHVITGHTEHSEGSPDYDYNLLAGLEGTLVFLMGLSNLKEIAKRLMDAGMARDTPAAVVACGTTDRQAAVRGSIADIAFRAAQRGMVPPAVIVIGKTAACQYHYCGKTSQRVGVTATKALQKKLERRFAAIGMEAVPVCDMKIVKTGQMARLRQELGHLEEYQWVVFTSQNAVSVFFEEMRDCRIDIRRLGSVKFAALGSGTADKLWEYGIAADFIPSSYTVQVFAEEFVESISEGDKVLIPRAVQGSAVLTDVLERHHVAFLNLAIYDVTGCPAEHIGMLEEMEYLVFVSASGVQEFFRLIRENAVTLPERIKIACIGGMTAKRLEECYREADIVADTSDVNGLARAISSLRADAK